LKFITLAYYALRSIALRGIANSIRLLKAEKYYEKKFGIVTSEFVRSENQQYFHYQGAPYLPLLRVLKVVYGFTGNVDFTDLGCGMGRALFVAEHIGYDQLTGIELNGNLLKMASENVLKYKGKRQDSVFDFVQNNVLDYSYQNKTTLYFLFNPFDAATLKKVLLKIDKVTSASVWFLYMNPKYQKPFTEVNAKLLRSFKTGRYTEAILYKLN
jgi:SAM-dependent methyltransferase